MAPLVLHNVPDEELYTGKDGVTRPFAIVGATDERRSSRLRRQAQTNHGSFGRTRARGRTGTAGPAGNRRAPQTTKTTTTTTTGAAADEVFGFWKKSQEAEQLQLQHHHHHGSQGDLDATPPGTSSGLAHKASSSSLGDEEESQNQKQLPSSSGGSGNLPTPTKTPNQPVEVILRGYRGPAYQYAALHRYEQIAGRICEDYPRDPPVGSSRRGLRGGGGSGLRDAAARAAATLAANGKAALTPAERAAVMRVDGGNHWVKVTFESAAAADAALYASPQSVLGYLVFAEPYVRGLSLPPSDDVAVPDPDALLEYERAYHERESSHTVDSGTVTNDDHTERPGSASSTGAFGTRRRRGAGGAPSSIAGSSVVNDFPGGWVGGSHRAESDAGTLNEVLVPAPAPAPPELSVATDGAFCRRIPTARRATLKAPELALLPRESSMRSFVKQLPLLHRLTGTIIGNQVPRREDGVFDWDKASLYWRLMWFLDYMFGLFGGEILDANKED